MKISNELKLKKRHLHNMMETRETGTYNMTNPNLIEHNEILKFYKEIVDNSFTWKNFNVYEQSKILKSERSNNYLNTDKLEKYCKNNHLEILNIRESIKLLLKKW